jgi:Protein of unknown function (DUF1592)/Protein of unknown function (DUF1588)/Protein of unknown function (DUF1587)/Protein of unknown function (DUF1585)/Protein of unknown function (DUF1595)
VGCHSDKLKTGGVSLANAANLGPETLERVFHKLRASEMPPVGMPRPDAATYTALTSWLETELDRNALAHPNPGAPAVHRLNRAEYRNAVRDVLVLDLDHSANLPPDDSGYGFDNIGDVLTVSPLHMEKYLGNARRIARLAVGTLKPSSALERFRPPAGTVNDSVDALPLNERGGILIHRYFPFDAEYSILVRVRGNPGPGMPPAKLDLRVDGKRVKLYDADIDTEEANQGTRNFELRLPFEAGAHEIGAAFLTENAKLEGGPPRGPNYNPSTNGLYVDYVAIGGPYDPKGPGDTESRKRIFICKPAAESQEAACARKILTSLTRQAYRRPVTAVDLDPLMKLFATGRADGSNFEAGIEMGLTAILVSPDFLFRVEHSNGHITDLELASRLSFFLWSSIPDEELLAVASARKLHDPAVLRTQTLRMLRDPKSQALLDNFAGQWLQLRNIAEWHPDPQKYPQFDEALRHAFERESALFFENIVREDRSVLELIDADYTFVNERLARYYGIPGVHGSYFRRVQLTGQNQEKQRGGVLTQGGVLMVTSYPTRTSPVLRGKWILENILGAPPPPPPPNVPQLVESAAGSAKSLREQLEKHRASAACASCHSRLDPLGFSLENYDGVGRYRADEDGSPIDASGSLSNGTIVAGPAGLKKVILEHKDEFVEVMAGKLLTYALGRGLEYYDQPALRQIRREMAADNDQFSALILGVVNSVPFQMRRAPAR